MRIITKPVLCNYYLTYRCNASCSFCDIWEKPSPYATLENIIQNLKDLKRLGVKVIDFTGGEPLLHRNIDQILTISKQMGFVTTLTTNTLLYPKWAEKINRKVDMLHFSLDSSVKEIHDQMRGVACFDSVINSIAIAKSLGERPDILFTVFDKNITDLENVYQQITQPNDLVLIINPVFEYNQVESGNQLNDTQLNYLTQFGKRKNVYLNQAFITLRKDGGNHIAKPICKAGSSTLVISPENKLIGPCYHLSTQEFEIKQNLFELYQSIEVKSLIAQEGKLKGCEGCTINCYMQPSFAVELNKYWLDAMPSTIKYNYMKGTWKKLLLG